MCGHRYVLPLRTMTKLLVIGFQQNFSHIMAVNVNEGGTDTPDNFW